MTNGAKGVHPSFGVRKRKHQRGHVWHSLAPESVPIFGAPVDHKLSSASVVDPSESQVPKL
jgi:hypothetical protein